MGDLFDSPEERFCALLLELMERCYDTGRTSVCLPKTGASGSEAPPDAIMGRIEHSITWMGVGDWSMREHAPGKRTRESRTKIGVALTIEFRNLYSFSLC